MQPHRQQQLDEQWLDSLLTAAYQADDGRERVAKVMRQLDQPSKPVRVRAHWASLQNLSALAIAASLLVLATFVMDNSQQRAYATVARSAKATPQIRHYRVHMLAQRPAVGLREFTADLYIDPTNRFVMKHPGMLGFGTAWVGGDASQRWIAPPRGPVIVGGEELMGRWLTGQDIFSPLLHLSSMLERMRDDYALTMLSDVALDGPHGTKVLCTHVRGDVQRMRGSLPRTIELWADVESGIAQKVILHWPPSPNITRRSPVRWTIELVDTPTDLPGNWFEIDGHAAGRPIVRARNDQDLEQNLSREAPSR